MGVWYYGYRFRWYPLFHLCSKQKVCRRRSKRVGEPWAGMLRGGRRTTDTADLHTGGLASAERPQHQSPRTACSNLTPYDLLLLQYRY
jgi:hypothetical protein